MRGIPSIAFLRRIALCGALAAALGLTACGGGGGGGGTGAGLPPPDPGASTPGPGDVPLPTRAQAARFLRQATFGATAAEIDRVAQIGYARWLDEQMALPPTLHQPACRTSPIRSRPSCSAPCRSSRASGARRRPRPTSCASA